MIRSAPRRLSLLFAAALLLPAAAAASQPKPRTAPLTPIVASPLPLPPRVPPPPPPAPRPGAKPAAPARPARPLPPPFDPTKGSVTGLPLPRWAALRADEVNMRVGPGMRYPIEWVYHRRDLPVQILREVDVWRLVQDMDGTKGWVHEATLVGHRTFLVRPVEVVLRAQPGESADEVAILQPGVVGRIRQCGAQAAWCEVQVRAYRGWLARSAFYGTSPGEPVNPGG
jgi:SH3-like domain-containing protein